MGDKELDMFRNVVSKEKLGCWYSFDVFYTNKELKEIPYSLNIKKHEDIAHVLKFIERTGKVKFEVNKNTIIVK